MNENELTDYDAYLAEALQDCRANLPGWGSTFSIGVRELLNKRTDKSPIKKNNLLYVDYIEWYSIFMATQPLAIRGLGNVWWIKKESLKEKHFSSIIDGELFYLPKKMVNKVWYEFNLVIGDDLTKVTSPLDDVGGELEKLKSYLAEIQKRRESIFGLSPLMLAISNGDTSKVEQLIDAGINVDEKDKGGNTALIIATLFGKSEIIDLLIRSGASTQIINDDGVTAFDIAKSQKKQSLIEKLS